MDDWGPLGPSMKIDRRATDWGLASLAVGGLFLLMAPVQLIFNSLYWSIGRHHAAPGEIQQARIAGTVAGLAFVGLIGFGIVCGFRGLGLARQTGQAAALPLAGIVIGFVDVVLWLGLSVHLLAILGMFQ